MPTSICYFWGCNRYDLIDLTRQVLAKYANEVFLKVIEAYQLNDIDRATSYSQHFLDLVKDMDILLGCHEGFLLGPWLESAKQLAEDQEQEKQARVLSHACLLSLLIMTLQSCYICLVQYEWNARTQITMWFDNTEVEASLLRDYGMFSSI